MCLDKVDDSHTFTYIIGFIINTPISAPKGPNLGVKSITMVTSDCPSPRDATRISATARVKGMDQIVRINQKNIYTMARIAVAAISRSLASSDPALLRQTIPIRQAMM